VLAVALQLERALEAPRRLLEGSGRQMRIGEAEPGKANTGMLATARWKPASASSCLRASVSRQAEK
jgi:hypothetical protein